MTISLSSINLGAATSIKEIQTATASQTVFNLTNTYSPGAGSLNIFINGVRQFPSAFTETNTTTVTFSSGLSNGDVVLFEIGKITTANTVASASTVTFSPISGNSATNVQDAISNAQTGISNSVPSIGIDGIVTRQMLKDCGTVYYNSGATNALDFTNGSHQRWAPAVGAQTLSITNWPPTGNLGELLIEGVNLGASTITWPTINWIKSDGTTTTTFSSNGVTLRASGTDWVVLWTRDAGTTLYGKVVR